jgi:riboflavin synthase
MFTGLVEAVGELLERTETAGGARLRIGAALAGELSPGDSLAVNGVCLTVSAVEASAILTDIGPETLRVTTLGRLAPGTPVNLERPMRADARFGGHFVQGHVDGIGRVDEIRRAAEFSWLRVRLAEELGAHVVLKGSIAVDGISLTVAALGADRFEVMVVPYTLEHTNLRRMRTGDPVNIEFDMIGKYVVRAVHLAGTTVAQARAGDVEQ